MGLVDQCSRSFKHVDRSRRIVPHELMYKIDRMRGLILHEDHESSSKAQAGLQGKVWMEITRGSGQAE